MIEDDYDEEDESGNRVETLERLVFIFIFFSSERLTVKSYDCYAPIIHYTNEVEL